MKHKRTIKHHNNIRVGRPTKYNKEMLPNVEKYAKLSLTNKEIALLLSNDTLKIKATDIDSWMRRIPEFADAIKKGRAKAKKSVISSLYNTALQGNVTAIIFWLCNRYPQEWSNVNRIEQTSKIDINAKVETKKISLDLFSVINQIGVEKAKEILEGKGKLENKKEKECQGG